MDVKQEQVTSDIEYNIKFFEEFILNEISNINVLPVLLPRELLKYIYCYSQFDPKILWLSNNFRF